MLKQGSTVEDVASALHKDIAKGFKYAKVWGSTKIEGLKVAKDYQVQHKDIVEISF